MVTIEEIKRQIQGLPKETRGELVENSWPRFIIHDMKEITHLVRVAPYCVYITSLKGKHTIIIGAPDPTDDPESETSLYVTDHAYVRVKGPKDGDLVVTVEHDDQPTKFVIDQEITKARYLKNPSVEMEIKEL